MKKNLFFAFLCLVVISNISCQQPESVPSKTSTLSSKNGDKKFEYKFYKDIVINKTPFKDVIWDYKFEDEKVVNCYTLPYAVIVETASKKLFYFESDGKLKWIYELDRNLWIPPAYVYRKPFGVKEVEKKIEGTKQRVAELRVSVTEETKAQLEEAETTLANLRREWESEDSSDFLYLITGTRLHCLYRKHGGVAWMKDLSFAPSGQPVALSAYVFVPAFKNNRLYAISARDGYEADWMSFKNQIQTGMIYKDPKLYFATEGGEVFYYSPETKDFRKINEARKRITGNLKIIEDTLYFGSTDYSVYALDISGAITWKFETGGPIWKEVWLAGDVVIANSHSKGLYGIDAKTGKQRFFLESGDELVAYDSNFIYLKMKDGGLATLNSKDGKIVRWHSDVPFEIFSFDSDGKIIYSVSKEGYICASTLK